VVSVRCANDVLRAMKNLDAAVLGAQAASVYGPGWQSIYYEADVMDDRGVLITVKPNQVVSIGS